MTFWIRVHTAALILVCVTTAVPVATALAQSSPRILPERKPPAPERAAPAAPNLPGKTVSNSLSTSAQILPERKPTAPGRSTTAQSSSPSRTPAAQAKLGARLEPAYLSARDRDLLSQALKAAGSSKWSQAFDAVRRTNNPALLAVIEWIAMRTPGAKVNFRERTAFIEAHPEWPAISELKRITEDVALDSGGPDERMRWFGKHPPVTTKGKVAYADAALATGDLPLAEKLSRDAWITGRFGSGDEREFLAQFSRFITPADHVARLEELLYAEQREPALRMISKVDTPRAAVATVRLALIQSSPGVERLLGKLPPHLAADPGLIYDRIKWRRTRDRDDEARALLPDAPDTAPRPDLWWRERNILARDALQNGNAREAYRIVINHGALDPVSVSEAEWFAGWIALRFLKDGNAALQHFQRVYDTVQLAANLSRGAYWTGRAAEELGRTDIAAEWYRKAAVHITTFYGQLALGRLNDPILPTLPQDQTPSPTERATFEAKNLTKAVRGLADVPNAPYLRSFVLALAESSDFAVDRHMAAELASRLGRPDLGVWIARQAGRDRIIIMTHGYPIPNFSMPSFPERALQLAIMRQESNFDTTAESPAGAMGLMQLMPGTAREVAKQTKQTYNKGRLKTDPSYNVRLGSVYLDGLVKQFEGSYIMAAAGYNAGPSRSRQWARTFGDPRSPDVDAIDWIESIPFSETRNYVQRVMENVMVYRALLAGTTTVPQTLERDLKAQREPQLSAQ